MTTNELIVAMVSRVKVLSDLSIKELRIIHPDNIGGPLGGHTDMRHQSRGECIEAILIEEFDTVDFRVE